MKGYLMFEWFEMNLWTSTAIIVIFSFVVVFLDEWVAKPIRKKRWERKAAAGDKEAQELLRVARSAHVVED